MASFSSSNTHNKLQNHHYNTYFIFIKSTTTVVSITICYYGKDPLGEHKCSCVTIKPLKCLTFTLLLTIYYNGVNKFGADQNVQVHLNVSGFL